MKQTLCFLQKFYWQMVGMFAAFAVILLWGCWVTRAQDDSNLFYIYLSIYSMFALIIPAAFGMSMRYYLELCISFGAVRASIFWALQLLGHLVVVSMLLLSTGVELFAQHLLPADKMNVAYSLLQPSTCLLVCLLSLLLHQGGICLGRVKQSRWLGIGIGVGIGCLGAYFGIAVASETIFLFDATQGWYWLLCAAVCLVTVGLFALSHRLYKKAVVSI